MDKFSTANELWLGVPAPRYTSYPPATAFHDSVVVFDYEDILAALPADEEVSLYLHIPFCRDLCLFCACNTNITRRDERVLNYLDCLQREMEMLSGLTGKPRRVSRLHLGGGTPNILMDDSFKELFSALNHFFDLRACREIAVELDPRLVTKSQAKTLASCGVTRVSLGVQDFNPAVQKIIHREQPFDRIEQACRLLRDAGVRHINFDMMYGLPRQTPASMAQSARQAASLRPDRIALFSYAHVPQIKKHQEALEAYGLPDPKTAVTMEWQARQVLVEAGYEEIGMDHFALPGDSLAKAAAKKHLRRNFQGYTDDKTAVLLGLGASAISRTAYGYFQNERDVTSYQKLVESRELAVVRGHRLNGADRLRAALIEELMCTMACDLEALCQKHHFALGSLVREFETLKPFIKAGIVVKDNFLIQLATPHRAAIRVICRIFDRYAERNESRSKKFVSSRAA